MPVPVPVPVPVPSPSRSTQPDLIDQRIEYFFAI